ncbi:MAG: hypothetical protein JXA07_02300 [Spirochaetes bacterium]|nr:hypothetical protein [Spirochaetota bacterium]
MAMKYNYLKGYDVVPDRQYLLMWGYRIGDLIRQDPSNYARPIFKVLLKALASLPACGSKRVWERRFIVYAGDFGDHFWVGIPGKMYHRVAKELGRSLESIPGFEFLEMGTVPHVPLVPEFLYDFGRVGEYCEEKLIGRTYRDKNWDSGISLEGRGCIPEGYMD